MRIRRFVHSCSCWVLYDFLLLALAVALAVAVAVAVAVGIGGSCGGEAAHMGCMLLLGVRVFALLMHQWRPQIIMEAFRAVLAEGEAAQKKEEEDRVLAAQARAELDEGKFDDPF